MGGDLRRLVIEMRNVARGVDDGTSGVEWAWQAVCAVGIWRGGWRSGRRIGRRSTRRRRHCEDEREKRAWGG